MVFAAFPIVVVALVLSLSALQKTQAESKIQQPHTSPANVGKGVTAREIQSFAESLREVLNNDTSSLVEESPADQQQQRPAEVENGIDALAAQRLNMTVADEGNSNKTRTRRQYYYGYYGYPSYGYGYGSYGYGSYGGYGGYGYGGYGYGGYGYGGYGYRHSTICGILGCWNVRIRGK